MFVDLFRGVNFSCTRVKLFYLYDRTPVDREVKNLVLLIHSTDRNLFIQIKIQC